MLLMRANPLRGQGRGLGPGNRYLLRLSLAYSLFISQLVCSVGEGRRRFPMVPSAIATCHRGREVAKAFFINKKCCALIHLTDTHTPSHTQIHLSRKVLLEFFQRQLAFVLLSKSGGSGILFASLSSAFELCLIEAFTRMTPQNILLPSLQRLCGIVCCSTFFIEL
jgi:hypothetical protein